MVTPIVVRGWGISGTASGRWSSRSWSFLRCSTSGCRGAGGPLCGRIEAIADPDRRNRVFSTSLALFGIIGGGIFAIALAISAASPYLFRIPPDLVVEARWMFVLLGLNFALGLPLGIYLNVLCGLGHYPTASAIRVTYLTLGSILTVTVITLGGGLIRDSMLAIPKVLASDAFRGSLRQIPLVQRLEATAYRWFEGLAPERREALRDRIEGPKPTPYREDAPDKPWLS